MLISDLLYSVYILSAAWIELKTAWECTNFWLVVCSLKKNKKNKTPLAELISKLHRIQKYLQTKLRTKTALIAFSHVRCGRSGGERSRRKRQRVGTVGWKKASSMASYVRCETFKQARLYTIGTLRWCTSSFSDDPPAPTKKIMIPNRKVWYVHRIGRPTLVDIWDRLWPRWEPSRPLTEVTQSNRRRWTGRI